MSWLSLVITTIIKYTEYLAKLTEKTTSSKQTTDIVTKSISTSLSHRTHLIVLYMYLQEYKARIYRSMTNHIWNNILTETLYPYGILCSTRLSGNHVSYGMVSYAIRDKLCITIRDSPPISERLIKYNKSFTNLWGCTLLFQTYLEEVFLWTGYPINH